MSSTRFLLRLCLLIWTATSIPALGEARASDDRDAPPTFMQWELWWEYNGAPQLGLRSRVKNVPSDREVQELVLPPLLLAVKERSSALVDSAVLALARSTPKELAEQVLPEIRSVVSHEDPYAKKAATLALGILGHAGARPDLLGLLRDDETGRELAKTPEGVPEAVRGFAALSLGRFAVPEDAEAILAVLESASTAGAADLQACGALALSHFATRHDVIVPFVKRRLADSGIDARITSYAPLALRGLEREPTFQAMRDVLLDVLSAEGKDEEVARSCVIALGKIAPFQDEGVVDTLFTAIQEHPDASTCYLACIALGEMGARDRKGFAEAPEPHLNLLYALLNEMARPRFDRGQSPWIALALTIYGRGHQEDRKAKEFLESIIAEVHLAFNGDAKDSTKGAYALALGLLGGDVAAGDLEKAYGVTRDDALKGYIAVALGLLQRKSALEALRADIEKPKVKEHLRLQLARSLALLDDTRALPPVVELLGKAKDIVQYAALAETVAILGGEKAIDPLRELLLEQDNPELERAYAAVALGVLAERSELPWGAFVSVGLNYLAATPAITEILTIM